MYIYSHIYYIIRLQSMSYKAVFELFLQIHQFENIDLPCQGIFRLRTSIYQLQGTQKVYATPFQFIVQKKKQNTNPKKIHFQQQIEPPYFHSKAGGIKYSDDKIVLDDEIRYKLQIQSFPRLQSENVYIEFDLLFSEYSFHPSNYKQYEGEIVANKKFRLENLQHGLLNYCEGEFTGSHSSKFAFTIFGCLSNFKFGKYKLPHQLQLLDKQDQQGNIKKKQNQNKTTQSKIQELQRSQIKTFEQLIKWVEKYYKHMITNPLEYFYHTYVKNLRYYFYHAQQKLNQKSIIAQKIILKVPKQYLQLPNSQTSPNGKDKDIKKIPAKEQQTEVGQKQFRKYMTDYQPEHITCNSLMQETNKIYLDIYMFLLQIQKQFIHDQLMLNKMKRQYDVYIKQRYGERIFRSIVNSSDINVSSRENKKIAKKMREKEKTMITVTYPIDDVSFTQAKDMLEFLFYQVTLPKQLPVQKKMSKKDSEKLVNKVEQQNNQKSVNKQITSQFKINQSIVKLENQESKALIQKSQSEDKNKQEQSQQKKDQQGKKQQNIKEIQKEPQQQKQQIQDKQIQTQKQEKKIDQKIDEKTKEDSKIETNQIQNKLPVKQIKEQPKQQKLLKQQTQEQEQEQDQQDVYKNINHQKGEIDSEITQKSFQRQNSYEKSDQECQVFQGISQIKLNQNQSKMHMIQELQKQQIPKLNYNQKDMLIVMCHGFQGSSYDMTIILRRLKELLPEALFLTAKSNQGMTQGNIQEMGERLAKQVESYVRNYMEKQTVILNFVGHSMGGVIARTAVKNLMKQYRNQFGFFCSLSSPHLGYLSGVDGMIKAGLWAIMKFKPIKSLQQLKMDDCKDLRKSFMYTLSKEGHLKRFRKIILFSSFEDSYVSWHSARICAQTKKKTAFSKLQQQMVTNILGNSPIHRIDVNFNVKTTNLDSFIGRTAHINLIVQQSLFKIISSSIPQLFDLRIL